MRYIPLLARILLGFVFFASGLAGLLKMMATPPNLPEKLQLFTSGLEASGYLLPLLQGTQLICGLLLLVGAFVPLALVVLAPVILNILLVHIFLEPNGLIIAIVLCALEIYLAFFASPYKEIVKQLFRCPMKESWDAKKAGK